MSEEYQAKSLAELSNSSPAKQEVVAEVLPQEGKDETVAETEVKAETAQQTKVEPALAPDLEKLLEEQERLNKRLKDTQAYANERNQTALKHAEKLHEAGIITDEEFEQARKSNAHNEQSEVQKATKDFWDRYNNVKDVLADPEKGYDPDEIVSSFDVLFGKDPTVMKEFMEAAPEKRIKFVLEKGKEGLDVYRGLKKYGSLTAFVAATKKEAADEAIKSYDKKQSDEETAAKPKAKPRLDGGGAGADSGTYSTRKLSNLMEN